MSTLKQSSINPKFTPETSKLINEAISKIDIRSLVKKDLEAKILQNEKNSIHHYNNKFEKVMAMNRPQLKNNIEFRSIHNLGESSATRRIIEHFMGPKYDDVQREVLKELHKKRGKLYLLSDIYRELTKEIRKPSQEEPKTQYRRKNIRYMPVENEDARKVEELDEWIRDKIQGREKPKDQHHELRTQVKELSIPAQAKKKELNYLLTPLSQSRAETPSHANRSTNNNSVQLPSLTPNGDSSPSKESVTKSSKFNRTFDDVRSESRRSSHAASNSATGGKSNRKTGSEIKYEDLDSSDEESINNLLESSQYSEFVPDYKEQTNPAEILKARVQHYRDLNMYKEEQLNKLLNDAEAQLRSKEKTMRTIIDENARIGKKIRQINRQLNVLEAKHNPAKVKKKKLTDSEINQIRQEIEGTQVPPEKTEGNELRETVRQITEQTEEEETEESEDEFETPQQQHLEKLKRDAMMKYTIEQLRDELQMFRLQLDFNIKEMNKIEVECEFYRKRIKIISGAKKIFYLRILKQGFDTRNDGLVWLVKALLKEKEMLSIDHLPEFLDTKSRSYLIQKGKLANQVDDLRSLRRSIIEIHKASLEYIDNKDRFKDLFEELNEDVENMVLYSKDMSSRETPVGEDSSYSFTRMMKDVSGSNSNTSREYGRKNQVQPTVDSLPEIKTDRSKSSTQSSSPNNNPGMTSFTVTKRDESNRKPTENELIYKKAKEYLVENYKKNHNPPKDAPKENTEEEGHVKIIDNGTVLNDYTSTAEFLEKVEGLQREIEALERKIRYEEDIEANRVWNEYHSRKSVADIGMIFTCLFGYPQALRYLNYFTNKTS